ncbi:hypothetical protein ACWKWP_01685 [Agromyces soli]
MTNPLVATAVDTSTPFQGAFLLEDGEALVSAIQSGNWVDGGLAAFSAIGDTVAAVLDPLGSLIAAGLGWVMEHLEPLKGWLNDLTGDAGEVAAFAQTWSNISTQLAASGDELVRILADLDSADGEAVQAYLRFQADAAEHIRAAGTWADAMSMGMQTASMMVQLVHDLTRDAIAQVVGSVISYAATLAVSLGTATPYVVAQATSRVSALATRVGTTVTKLLRSSDELMRLIDKLGTLFRKLDDLASKVLPGGGRGSGGSGHAPDGVGHAQGEPGHGLDRRMDVPVTHADDGVPAPGADTAESFFEIPGSDRSIPRADYDAAYEASVHNPDAESVMLGKFHTEDGSPNYIERAGDDHTYFDLGDDWDRIQREQGLSNQQMFDVYNKRFLDDAIAGRKVVNFSQNPSGDPGYLGQELKYLQDHGYRFDPDTMSARPRGA